MPAARLLIGPLLRRVVGTRATVWVETSAPAAVTARTAGGASGPAPGAGFLVEAVLPTKGATP